MCVQILETLDEARGWRCGVDVGEMARAETILFVEDEAFVRDVTCEVLRSAGYQVLTARTAADAVRIYDERRGDVKLLLSDVILPGETGRALAGRLRRRHPGLKVLLVTGYSDQIGGLQAMQEEYLGKPFSTEVLLGRVRELLDRTGQPLEGQTWSGRPAVTRSLQNLSGNLG